jgi:hypothetical protein
MQTRNNGKAAPLSSGIGTGTGAGYVRRSTVP